MAPCKWDRFQPVPFDSQTALVGQRHIEYMNHWKTCWSTAFRRLSMSNAAKAAKACTPTQSGAVQLGSFERSLRCYGFNFHSELQRQIALVAPAKPLRRLFDAVVRMQRTLLDRPDQRAACGEFHMEGHVVAAHVPSIRDGRRAPLGCEQKATFHTMDSLASDLVHDLKRAVVPHFEGPSMSRAAGQTVVSVVRGTREQSIGADLGLNVTRAGAPTNAKDMPDFARILLIDADGVMRTRRTIVRAPCIVVVTVRPRIHKQTIPAMRNLDGERIRVGVARLIRRSNFPHVVKHSPGITMPGDDPGISEPATTAR